MVGGGGGGIVGEGPRRAGYVCMYVCRELLNHKEKVKIRSSRREREGGFKIARRGSKTK